MKVTIVRLHGVYEEYSFDAPEELSQRIISIGLAEASESNTWWMSVMNGHEGLSVMNGHEGYGFRIDDACVQKILGYAE